MMVTKLTTDMVMSTVCAQCPMFKIEGDKTVAEPFAEEAKYFTEVRLLQRDVKIVLEGASNQNLLGTVIHPVIVVNLYVCVICAKVSVRWTVT